jgi:hypothetical protein
MVWMPERPPESKTSAQPPPPTRPGWWERIGQSTVPSIIAAAAAVIAAVLTVQSSGDATLAGIREQGRQQLEAIHLTAREQAAREAAETEQRARGAARVLFTELLVSGYAMTDLALSVYWDAPFGRDYPVTLPSGDLQLVAARLSPLGYRKVGVALSNIDGLGRYVAQRASRAPYHRHPLTRRSLELIARDVRTLNRAAEPVARLGKLQGVSFPTLSAGAAWRNVLRTVRKYGIKRPS